MIEFSQIKMHAKFVYDGDTYVKTGDSTAWQMRNGRRWKEWGFLPDDRCKPL